MQRLSLFASLQTVKQMWPYICQFVEKVLRETVEPAIKESNSHLSTFCFSKIDIGEKVSAALLSDGVSLQPTALRKQTNKLQRQAEQLLGVLHRRPSRRMCFLRK